MGGIIQQRLAASRDRRSQVSISTLGGQGAPDDMPTVPGALIDAPVVANEPPSIAQRLQGSRDRRAQPVDFDTGEMVSNIPSSAWGVAKDTATALYNPIDTARSIKQVAYGTLQKAIPGEHPDEQAADAAGKYLSERYGGWDEFKTSIMQDPVGVLADFASVFTGVGGVARAGGKLGAKVGVKGAPTIQKVGEVLSKTGQVIDPINIAAQTAIKGVARVPGLDKAAAKLYQSGVKFPTTKGGDAVKAATNRNRNVETALNEGIMPTDAGLEKLDSIVGQINTRIEKIINEADIAGKDIPVAEITKAIKELRIAARKPGPDSLKDERILKKMEGDLHESMLDPTTGAPSSRRTLTPSEVQDLKKRTYERVNYDAKEGTTSQAAKKGRQAIASDAREQVAKLDPRIDELNKRQAPLLDMKDDLAKARNRIENRNSISLTQMIAATAGAGAGGSAFGGAGAVGGIALGAVLGLINNPKVQARSGILLKKLIKKGMEPKLAAEYALIIAAQEAAQAGRAIESTKDEKDTSRNSLAASK